MSSQEEFFKTIAEGNENAFKTALATAPEVASARNDRDVSALMWALYHRREAFVEALLKHRPELDIFEAAALGDHARLKSMLADDPEGANRVSPDGFTPLHLASFFGHESAARVLVEAGADVNCVAANESRVRPIHSAVAVRSTALVKLLLDSGADPNAAQMGGWTALHAAAKHEMPDAVRALLDHGADPAQPAEDGSTPLALATDANVRSILSAGQAED